MNKQPAALPEHDGIPRYLDAGSGRPVVRLAPGQLYVTQQDEWLVTTVGSCVAVCLLAPNGWGGMNHVMLPYGLGRVARSALHHAPEAVDKLVHELRLHSTFPARMLQAWVFGGAGKVGSVGEATLWRVLHALEQRRIPVMEAEYGGLCARRVEFHPPSATIRCRTLTLTGR